MPVLMNNGSKFSKFGWHDSRKAFTGADLIFASSEDVGAGPPAPTTRVKAGDERLGCGMSFFLNGISLMVAKHQTNTHSRRECRLQRLDADEIEIPPVQNM